MPPPQPGSVPVVFDRDRLELTVPAASLLGHNSALRLLVELGVSTPEGMEVVFPSVRDSDEIGVMRCRQSGAMLLTTTKHACSANYEGTAGLEYWGDGAQVSRQEATQRCLDDDCRRAALLREMVRGRVWIDVGSGAGGIFDQLDGVPMRAIAVEPQPGARAALIRDGIGCFDYLESIPGDVEAGVISYFHVLEHLPDPLQSLRQALSKLAPGGAVVVEVPHAKDALLDLYNCDSFKRFTFWSEHLILHTRQSIATLLRHAGFCGVTVSGVQRYPLANHLHWLSRGRPNGHNEWAFLRSPELDAAYAARLEASDVTDTILAVGYKPT